MLKKKINHPILGKLVYSDKEYTGRAIFKPVNDDIDVYFNCPNEEFDEEYSTTWGELKEKFVSVLDASAKVVAQSDAMELLQGIWNSVESASQLVVEGVEFQSISTIKIFWGVVDENKAETEWQVVTSYDFYKDFAEYLGTGD